MPNVQETEWLRLIDVKWILVIEKEVEYLIRSSIHTQRSSLIAIGNLPITGSQRLP